MPPILYDQNQNAPENFPLAQELAAGGSLAINAASDIEWAIKKLSAKRERYLTYQAYYDGYHKLAFSTEGYRTVFADMLKSLRANICPAVVSAITDKLSVVGFESHSSQAIGDKNAAADDDKEADEAWALWEDDNLTLLADQVHDDWAVNGDAYVIVWPDEDGKATYYANDATEVCVRYNVERKDRIDVAAKLWREGNHWRLTLYYDDRLEKYRTVSPNNDDTRPVSATAFAKFKPEEDPDWPLMHEYKSVPVFHWPYMGGQGQDGLSELHDVIPVQDALNKALADLIVAEEFGAYVQRWATGVSADSEFNPETNQIEEKPLPFKVGIDRILTVGDAAAKFGQFAPTDLDKFINVVNAHVSLVGKIKGIPAHYFNVVTGDFPSGESQRTAEGRLVKRAERLQRRAGAIWARVMAFAMLVNKTGDGTLGFRAKWATAEPRATSEQVTNFKMATDGGMPMQTAAKLYLDMSESAIAEMMATKDTNDREALISAQDAFGAAMDKGAIVPPATKTPGNVATPPVPAAQQPASAAAR